ncbi:hypothetical protein scyTo_0007633, partial [Scyliorhinus torazame]|nr:hypothetical protein [Scyliorhinus torazame]
TKGSVQISNVTLVENRLGIFPIVYGSSAIYHQLSNKHILINNALVVGINPNINCSDVQPDDSILSHSEAKQNSRQATGRNGICWPTFASGANSAPYHPHDSLMSYPAISGLMTIESVVVQSVVEWFLSERDYTSGRIIMIWKANPADCVDMVCDAKKKVLLKDVDGSFLGAVGAVIPQSEYQWDGDQRYGMGDYRIPKTMLTYLNGSRIPVSQIAPHKGIIRDSTCIHMPDWQSYKCFGLNYEMLVIESLDPDTETRRLSPVALLSEGYVDLINGAVRLAIYYSTSQRLEVYVNNNFVAPTNVEWDVDHSDFTLKGPTYEGEFIPKLDSPVTGANYFDRTYQMLNVLVRGSTPIEIHTSPVLHISFNLPAMTVDEFYGPNLVQNLALFLNVPPNKIRVTNIVRETGHRRKRATGITVEVEIGEPPMEQLSSSRNNSTNSTSTEGKLQFSDLKEFASNLGEAMLTGNLSVSLGFAVSALDITSPVPPPGDAEWAQPQRLTRYYSNRLHHQPQRLTRYSDGKGAVIPVIGVGVCFCQEENEGQLPDLVAEDVRMCISNSGF